VTTVGLINPGAMGASVGNAARGRADRVLWVSAGRRPATRERAERAGLEDCGSMAELFAQSDIVLSICPPHNAGDVARSAVEHRFGGLYVEANAINPERTRSLCGDVTSAGARFVDGGIIGGPAWQAESGTRLWLSGEHAAEVAALFEGSPLATGIVGERIGAASALKMTFAAYTKGSTALLMAILAVAETEGVRESLAAQWGEAFTAATEKRLVTSSAKAWRFAGEMREIAATFSPLGLDGFHEAAARVFERLDAYKDWQEAPAIDALIASACEKRKDG